LCYWAKVDVFIHIFARYRRFFQEKVVTLWQKQEYMQNSIIGRLSTANIVYEEPAAPCMFLHLA